MGMGSKMYLGFDEELRANVYWMPDGKRMYKYLDGRIEVIQGKEQYEPINILQ